MSRNIFFFLLSLLTVFFFPTHPSFSNRTSGTDSILIRRDSSQVFFFNNDVSRSGTLPVHAYDTSIFGFQDYDPLYNTGRFHATLGNISSASRNLRPYPDWKSGGFDFGIHTFDPYLLSNDSVKYYRILKTFTELHYVQGAKKELFFNARFSRNIYRSLNLGFDFRVLNSPGAYLRQKTNLINFVLTTQFLSKTKRYGVIANFLVNRINAQENGGIKYDSLFEQNIEPNRQVIAVNLDDAQNRIKDIGFYMEHFFNLADINRPSRDSTPEQKKRIDLGRLTYSFQYYRQIYNYIDEKPGSGFYPVSYFDSTQTSDSITVAKIVNELSWTNPQVSPGKKYRVFQLEARIKQQYIEVTYPQLPHFILSDDSSIFASVDVANPYKKYYLNQIIPSFWISVRPFSTFLLESSGDYVFGDYNEGDMSLRIRISQLLGQSQKNAGTLSLTGFYSYQKPSWFYEHYSSNHFIWNYDWEKQGLIAAAAAWSWRYFETGASMNRITNYVYLDNSGIPKQESEQIGYICAWLNTNIDLWRFNFRGQFAYQTVQGPDVMRLPAFLGNLTVVFTQPLFKNAATIQPGLNFFYNTNYYANNYMPATRMFYLQKSEEIGNYIYMDVFLNVKIQRALLYLTYTHFNASFMGRTYYTVPSYPMQDAAFKFGISWRFYD